MISPAITQTAFLNGECDEVCKIENTNFSETDPGLPGQAQNMRKFPIFKNKLSHLTFPAIRMNASLNLMEKLNWANGIVRGKGKVEKIGQSLMLP